MTAATYTNSKPIKAAKRPRARAAAVASPASIDEQPMFTGVPAYARLQERKSSRLPLIAGGIAVVATIALVAGTSQAPKSAAPATPARTAAVTAPVAPVAAEALARAADDVTGRSAKASGVE